MIAESPKAVEFFDELYELYQENRLDKRQKYSKLRTLLELIGKDMTKDETMHTSSLFARLAFLKNKYKLSNLTHWKLQMVRVTSQKVRKYKYTPTKDEWLFAVQTVAESISFLYGDREDGKTTLLPIPDKLKSIKPEKVPYKSTPRKTGKTVEYLRVEVQKIDTEEDILICVEASNEEETPIKVKFNVPDWNINYAETISDIWVGCQLNLLDAYLDEKSIYYPRHFVFEPDYLIDVTGVAECFQKSASNSLAYLNRKFEITETSAPMQLGNIANFFLDELLNEDIQQPIDFMETFKKTFNLYPIQYSTIHSLSDSNEFKDFFQKAQNHFNNIRRVIREDLKSEGINEDNCYIEPSFYSEKYGFQGRLDLLHFNQKQDEAHYDIFELKSSKSVPTMELNKDGMWVNHKVQALIYRMLLQSVFGVAPEQINPSIFYSAVNQKNLRFTPPVKSFEQEILNTRNQIVIRELRLAKSPDGTEAQDLLKLINEQRFFGAPPFTIKAVQHFQKSLRKLSPLEQAYLFSFITFIAKEQQLSKIGDTEFSQGIASLWLDDFETKADSFNIFYDLEIEENCADEPKPYIRFKRTNENNSFVNFREGDIAVLYPKNNDTDTAMNNQIFKCYLSSVTKDYITVRFRYRQRNLTFFEKYDKWAIEHDVLDNGFNTMYKGLFSFLSDTETKKKQVLMGLDAPRKAPLVTDFQTEDNLNEEERRIIGKALATKDYFLVVGPPGTGKTSRMLKNMTANLHAKPETNILLLAYTNRAVDEICESVETAITETVDGKRKFIRIGQEFSTAPHFRDNLLDKVVSEAKNRQEVKDIIGKHRIFIGTLASMTGKMELFKLKDFDIAIVDEASQILEPQIVGLLPKVNRFILIGDHKQLPAIVQQEPALSATEEPLLHEIGLHNRRNAYFERMFNRCQEHGWDWAFDMLTHQGRMHQELSVFSNQSFYDNKLTTIPLPWQHAELDFKKVDKKNKFEALLSEHRLLFVPSSKKTDDTSDKTNSDEARLVVDFVKAVKALYLKNNKPFDPLKTVGIITPYRNQIAQIRHELEKAGVEEAETLTIDTVERYQGSQREVIIISFCANTPFQVQNLMSLTDDGIVDRKLNVAITRARQQMVFIGNEELLSRENIFYRLIEWVKSENGYIKEGIHQVLENNFQLPSEHTKSQKGIKKDSDFEDILKQQLAPTNEKYDDINYQHYIRNIVLNYGKTDFDEPTQHDWDEFKFSAKEKVETYYQFYFKKYFYASKHVFETNKALFQKLIEQNSYRTFFFDFGCGTMASGLAFNQAFKSLKKHFIFNYVGIDPSENILEKAEQTAKSGLLSTSTYHNFVKKLSDANWGYIKDSFQQRHTVIFNFAYLFSSVSLKEAIYLAYDINRITKQFPNNQYILVYQSSVCDQQNYNFKHFMERLEHLKNKVSEGGSNISIPQTNGCDYDKTEDVYFEIIG